MAEFYHSVTLNEEKCVGCTNCIKRCPTEAIRVRGGKAVIASERCIDCGEWLSDFTYTIALPAPSLYGQFNNLDDIDYVLTGLKEMGFDDVFEVSRAAELVSEATRKLMDAGALKRPVISSACPAVVRLIRVRFPDLCDHVLPLKSPMETAAAMAKRDAVKKTGLPPQQIGCFFLTPCPAKVTDIEMPLGIEKSQVDGAIAISEVFPELSHKMDHLEKVEPLANSGVIGVGWSTSGGEAAALLNEKYLAADGIENVIRVLEEIEDERIGDLELGLYRAQRLFRRVRRRGALRGEPLRGQGTHPAAAEIPARVPEPPKGRPHPQRHGVGGALGVLRRAHPFQQLEGSHGDDASNRRDREGVPRPGLRCLRRAHLPRLCRGRGQGHL